MWKWIAHMGDIPWAELFSAEAASVFFFLRTHLDAACEQLRVQKSACELEEAEGALQQPSPDTPTNANTRVLYL